MVGPTGVELFISSDMFYLEIILDTNGTVRDVKVHHEAKVEQQSCVELVNCLSRGDFADFTAQLEGININDLIMKYIKIYNFRFIVDLSD